MYSLVLWRDERFISLCFVTFVLVASWDVVTLQGTYVTGSIRVSLKASHQVNWPAVRMFCPAASRFIISVGERFSSEEVQFRKVCLSVKTSVRR